MYLQRLFRVSGTASGLRTGFRRVHSPKPTPVLDEVYKVAHNIVRNMTEMELTKMLNVYCGSEFLDYFGQVHRRQSIQRIREHNSVSSISCRRDIWT
jgi:hypothetical protein